MPDDDSFTSFFIRFKQNVDSHIAAAIRSTLGIPSSVSKSMYIDGRWPETKPAAAGSAHASSQATSEFQSSDGHSIWSSLSPEFLAEVEASAETMYQFSWMSFLVDSPYSPLKLKHLPQPVPRDLPEGADPSVFGFEDAFEDLLRVTSGEGLGDINRLYIEKREWSQMFPRGLPSILWLHQLTRQGLWDGWEPRPDFLDKAIRERWRRWLGDQNDPFHSRMDGAAAGNTEPKPPGEEKKRIAAQVEGFPPKSEEAEIEEELYELVAHGKVLAKSLQAAISSITKLSDMTRGPSVAGGVPGNDLDPSIRLPDGFREEVTNEGRKEEGGFTTVTRTRVVYDKEGRVVSRSTRTKVSPTTPSEA